MEHGRICYIIMALVELNPSQACKASAYTWFFLGDESVGLPLDRTLQVGNNGSTHKQRGQLKHLGQSALPKETRHSMGLNSWSTHYCIYEA